MQRSLLRTTAALAALIAAPALAQDGELSLELNKAETVEAGCRLTYVLHNETGSSISGHSVSVAVFDAQGVFDRHLVFRFGGIGDGRTKIQQFDLVGTPCEAISRLLVEGITECRAEDGSDIDCAQALVARSATDIVLEF